MSYGDAIAFLKKHTQVVELAGSGGARVAVCPAWQGRVMTATCAGDEGPSFGFVYKEFIESGKLNPHFNNYGGADRMWLSPEGGQFGLWFKPGDAQNLTNWFTPPALNEGAWAVAAAPSSQACRMTQPMAFGNASATQFSLMVDREVRLASAADLGDWFGATVAKTLGGDGVRLVGYETINAITNQGPAMQPEKGLVSIWMLGMLNSSPRTVVMVPYRAGSEEKLGPVVKSDYFGAVPPERLKVTPEAILFLCDGECRSKIGASQRRARNVLGSIDFQASVLTLVQFTMPANPAEEMYLNNMWELPQAKPFVGDVANSYNDGPPAPGQKSMGGFYEIESLSPAKALATGEKLVHHHRTVHIQADMAVLSGLAKDVLGVDLAKVRQTMLPAAR